ncbi:gamma-aminobutyric acid type B receptor subunit 2-like [Gadus chalcogrammus]|uniref:gamma-aminobutyric acid type B receptor subunit 2-like n=1 Tax=Gadus chalcogrammus TaxID=1042646 RepID=UPI0024C3E72D|nr:gamma-aminobutyric acid type B receptor subunit 2-like [Gadus chalcogrammus]
MRMKRLVLVLTCLWASPPCLAQVRSPMPVLWVMPVATVMPGEQNVTAALAPAVSIALEDLRGRGGPQMHLQLLDSQCDSATALKGIFDAMWEEPGHMIIFGGVCPQVTALLAQSLHALDMVQLSFTALPAGPPAQRRPPGLFSTVPSEAVFNAALVRLLQHYRWTRVGLLTQEGARLSQMRQNLVHQLMKADVQMVEAQSVGEDPCLKLQKLKDRGVRVLVAQVDEGPGSRVLCCAYRLNLFGSGYQWLLASGPGPVWTLDPEVSGCSLYALHAVLEGSIRLSLRPLGNSGLRGVSGRTPAEYEQAYRSEIRQQGAPDAYLHGYAYDGVWVLARAVSLLTEQFRHRKRHSPDRNLSINQAQTADMLLAALKQTQFEGVTGPVWFHNGERVASIELRQFQGASPVLVGQYNTFTQELRLFPDHLRFPGSGPAPDGSGVRLECGSVGRVLYAVVTSAAALLFITTLIFLLRSLSDCTRYRSPRGCGRPLDPLLLLGMMLALSWVPLAGLDEALAPAWWWDPLCSRHSGVPLVTQWVPTGDRSDTVRLWVLTLGHCVALGVLTTRSLNIYRHLLPRPGAGTLSSAEEEQDGVSADTDCCVSSNMDLWITALYAYKGPLLGLACFLAGSLRSRTDVTRAVTREGHRVALSVFAVAASSSLGALGGAEPRGEVSCSVPPAEGATQRSAPESQEGGVQRLTTENQELRRRRRQLMIVMMKTIMMVVELMMLVMVRKMMMVYEEGFLSLQLDGEIDAITTETDSTPPPDQQISDHIGHAPGRDPALRPPAPSGGGCVQRSSTVAQISCHSPPDPPGPQGGCGGDGVNTPERLRRRMSVQLPILHHAYHPVVGGVASSHSSQLETPEAPPPHHYTPPAAVSQV